MLETHYAKAGDGVHVAYQVDGDGPVDIIQVPGFVSNVEVYTQFPAYEIEARRFGSFARRIRTLGLVLLGSFARMFPAPDYDIGGDAAEMAALVSDLEERWGDGSSLRRFVPQYIDTHPEALAPLAQYERQSASPGAAREHPRPRGADRRGRSSDRSPCRRWSCTRPATR